MKYVILLVFVFLITHGMDRQALRALYKDEQHQWIAPTQVQINTCGICLEPGKLKRLSCHKEHIFHADCIEEWRKVNNTCPNCRAEIKDSIVCNCLEGMARPGVCIPCCGILTSLITSGEQIVKYIKLFEAITPTCMQHCNACACFCVYCAAALSVGPMMYCIAKNKRN